MPNIAILLQWNINQFFISYVFINLFIFILGIERLVLARKDYYAFSFFNIFSI